MEATDAVKFPSEIISLDGHTIIFRYAKQSNPAVLDSIRETLANQKIQPKNELVFAKPRITWYNNII